MAARSLLVDISHGRHLVDVLERNGTVGEERASIRPRSVLYIRFWHVEL